MELVKASGVYDKFLEFLQLQFPGPKVFSGLAVFSLASVLQKTQKAGSHVKRSQDHVVGLVAVASSDATPLTSTERERGVRILSQSHVRRIISKVGVVHFRPMTQSSHGLSSAKWHKKCDRNRTKSISSPVVARVGQFIPSSLDVALYLQELGLNRSIKKCFEEEIPFLQTPGLSDYCDFENEQTWVTQ